MLKSSLATFLFLVCSVSEAQWQHSYPRADGYDHQIYLEGYELPLLASGAMDPAPSPGGLNVAFSSRGWLWLLNSETGVARRITSAGGVDSRPEWSPDGKRLVFVRDVKTHFQIVQLDLESFEETILVDSKAINLDPVWSPGGKSVFYASAEGGTFEIWKVVVDTLERKPVTESVTLKKRPLKRRPQLLDPDSLVIYLYKQNYYDAIRMDNLKTGETVTLLEDWVTSRSDLTLSPDGRHLAYIWPNDEDGHDLRMMAVQDNSTSVLVTRSQGLPLAPQFSSDGEWLYFSEANENEYHELKRVNIAGGAVEPVEIKEWDWGEPTGRLTIRSLVDGEVAPVRIRVNDSKGHPIVPDQGVVRSEGQHKTHFFYSPGEITLTAPVGQLDIAAVHGLETAEVTRTAGVAPGRNFQVDIELDRIWDASEHGWYSGDNHFHLNYGGQYRLDPEDILVELEAETVDFGYALLANLHNRFFDKHLIDYRVTDGPLIEFGLEPRAHLLGHLNLLGVDELFWPWVWGPFYQVYGDDDRLNADALRFARNNGGIGGYVHPVYVDEPFAEENIGQVPAAFVADAVLGEVDLLEIACLWSWEIGTAALWHAVLNLGIPVAASAGSDAMNDLNRTFPTGSSRIYVKPDGRLDRDTYLDALVEGRSFVSTGPMVEFEAAGVGPGGVISPEGDSVEWTLNVHSALPYQSVQIFVNGEVVAELEGSEEAGSKQYTGSVSVPAGGWITARVLGENTGWPAMDSYLYAESSPVWFYEIGSTDPDARKKAAEDLLKTLKASQVVLQIGYGNTRIPKILAHFEEARSILEKMVGD